MPTPLVSVIMNCFNSSRDLSESILSCLQQTMDDFEIVFFDNCSTDESPQIAQSFGPKVRYLRGKTHVALGAARNLALLEAKGQFIAFLDCDDLWEPKKLERQLICFEDPKVGLVTTDTVLFSGRRTLGRIFQKTQPARGYVFTELMQRQWISMSSAMVRKEALTALSKDNAKPSGGWFDETLNVCEEADLFYRIAHDWKVDYVDEPLTFWRIHDKNTTFQKFGQFADETLAILAKHRRLYPGYDTEHADLVQLLEERARFQKAVALWQKGESACARAELRLLRNKKLKYRLFTYCTFLPSSLFSLLSRLYFALPAFFKR